MTASLRNAQQQNYVANLSYTTPIKQYLQPHYGRSLNANHNNYRRTRWLAHAENYYVNSDSQFRLARLNTNNYHILTTTGRLATSDDRRHGV